MKPNISTFILVGYLVSGFISIAYAKNKIPLASSSLVKAQKGNEKVSAQHISACNINEFVYSGGDGFGIIVPKPSMGIADQGAQHCYVYYFQNRAWKSSPIETLKSAEQSSCHKYSDCEMNRDNKSGSHLTLNVCLGSLFEGETVYGLKQDLHNPNVYQILTSTAQDLRNERPIMMSANPSSRTLEEINRDHRQKEDEIREKMLRETFNVKTIDLRQILESEKSNLRVNSRTNHPLIEVQPYNQGIEYDRSRGENRHCVETDQERDLRELCELRPKECGGRKPPIKIPPQQRDKPKPTKPIKPGKGSG